MHSGRRCDYIYFHGNQRNVNKNKVLMLMRMPEPPVTGGEIYYSRLREYLKVRFAGVANISWQTDPYKGPLRYVVSSVLKNLSLLKHLKSIDSNTVILEDAADSHDLFLFNAATRVVRGILGRKIYIVPVVHHLDSPLIKKKMLKKLKLIEEEIFFNSSDGIVVNSEFTKGFVKDALRREIEIVIAYPGLNVSGLGKNLEVKPKCNDIHLLFVGYITSRKGVDTLIRAFEILVKRMKQDNLVLHIAGDLTRDPNFSQQIKDYSEEAGLAEKVIFHGRVGKRELEELYSSSDIFVFPSTWEGFGMVLAEAASYGMPIVATDAGAIPYLVKDGVNGLLTCPRDAEKLALAIERLASSPTLRMQFGKANKRLAEEFDWDKSFSKVARLLENLNSD
jgi:glycosyltransferase involved in cell wall biosynthesis